MFDIQKLQAMQALYLQLIKDAYNASLCDLNIKDNMDNLQKITSRLSLINEKIIKIQGQIKLLGIALANKPESGRFVAHD